MKLPADRKHKVLIENWIVITHCHCSVVPSTERSLGSCPGRLMWVGSNSDMISVSRVLSYCSL